jgi:CrcB protein
MWGGASGRTACLLGRVSAAVILAVGVVGGLGSIARFTLDGSVSGRLGRGFPYGTLAVNLTGAFLLGAVTGAALGTNAARIAGTGFVGAYTTFSTWMLETHRLGKDGRLRFGVLNVAVSVALGLAAAWLARRVGAAL